MRPSACFDFVAVEHAKHFNTSDRRKFYHVSIVNQASSVPRRSALHFGYWVLPAMRSKSRLPIMNCIWLAETGQQLTVVSSDWLGH